VDLIPVQLPGRGRRLQEPLFTDLIEVSSIIAQHLLESLDRPFALFGHSMGALIAFEVAQTLRSCYGVLPVLLMVAGCPAPQIGCKRITYSLPDDEFKDELRRLNGTPEELLSNAEAMGIMMPTIRADFQMVETYLYGSTVPLRCPILAFGGLQDTVTIEELNGWRVQTVDHFSLQMFEGDHFFPATSRDNLLAAITAILSRLC
jgi:medium-chain acyl-[acyl-carrier-protein] hydrolase